MGTNFCIEFRGRYSAVAFAESLSAARFLVDCGKARSDVSVIRVTFPGGA